jgi:hypothetical protein
MLTILFAALLISASAFGQGMTKGMMSPPANVRPPGLQNLQTSTSAMKPARRSAWEITSARSR